MRNQNGFSIMEIILAMLVVSVFASTAVSIILQSFIVSRQVRERLVAQQFMTEGLEGLQGVRNRSYSALTPSASTGIVTTNGFWELSGTNTVLDKYTRTLNISSGQRNGSGNIVVSGGVVDSNTSLVSSVVNWKFTPSLSYNVNNSMYLTNWREPYIPKSGMLVYASGTDRISYRIYSGSGTWATAGLTSDVSTTTTDQIPKVVELFESRTRNEKILISKHIRSTTNYIYAQIFNGTTWTTTPQLITSYTNTDTFYGTTKTFDGVYLANGNFMLVYSNSANIPRFAIWNGTTWTTNIAMQTLPAIPYHTKISVRPGTNEVMALMYLANKQTRTEYFNGGTFTVANWTLHTPIHSTMGAFNDNELVDFAWSTVDSTKGVMVLVGTTNLILRANLWTANGTGSGAWGTATNSTAENGNIWSIRIASVLNTDRYIVCAENSGSTNRCFFLNNSLTWVRPTNYALTTTGDADDYRSFDISMNGISNIDGLTVFTRNTTIAGFKRVDSSTSTIDLNATTIGTLGGVLSTVLIIPQKNNDDMMVLMGGVNNSLYTAVWNGTTRTFYTTPAGKAFQVQTTAGSTTNTYWFSFVWDE
ncbi:MAG: type II secretion system protein [Candidatus Roizmanbacteria bacterium]